MSIKGNLCFVPAGVAGAHALETQLSSQLECAARHEGRSMRGGAREGSDALWETASPVNLALVVRLVLYFVSA